MYEFVVRPVFEYVGDIGGEKKWKQIEIFQRMAGRMILGVGVYCEGCNTR